ncbi:uridine kinase family protein [Cellulosimicrobium cellulans]|uniref:uridine kinase family protein n=1 Tax=Cellulosimicrobium cellulans TaxID=1710 RepID=UPI00209695DA|nr:AAA family ATPase [Cellulosimicrobium cellulans]MCO7273241.1 AAA family ATPase [Cellulosimicrobium cellulans]
MSVDQDVLADLVRRVRDADPRLGPSHGPGNGPAGERASGTRLVVIDGPAGSGKTTLAAQLGEALPAQVLHMDDLYEGWRGLEPAWSRLDEWVLAPLAAGRPGRYRRFDWTLDRFAEWHDVAPAPYLVVEGCGAGRREADGVAALRLWVEAPDDVRLRRGLDRDGEDQRAHWLAWMLDEHEHYARNASRERADVVLDGWGNVVRAADR